MRAGVCSYWFNRGQGTVGRYISGLLEDAGIETHVLARPTKANFVRPGHVDRGDVWARPRLDELSAFEAGPEEYEAWAEKTGVEVAFFFQNYNFAAISALRRRGVRTIGCFMWESFKPEHAQKTREAYDLVYSLTAAGRDHLASLGIGSVHVPFGCHPELLEVPVPPANPETCTFLYVGGYLSARKPTGAVLQAFRALQRDDVRLVLKAQRPPRPGDFVVPTSQEEVRLRHQVVPQPGTDDLVADHRIRTVTDDLSAQDYYRMVAEADVCIGVSRWEGLGLHLYEAIGLGRPVLASNMPPVDEAVVDGKSGILVGTTVIGHRPNGIPSCEPILDQLTAAMEVLADRDRRAALTAGALARRDELSWDRTVDGYLNLLEMP